MIEKRAAPPTVLDDVIRSRRAIRKYDAREVPDALIEEVLDLCRHAPSSMNGQPWCFVVIRDPATKREIAALKDRYCHPDKRAYRGDFLIDAPVVVLVAVSRARSHGRARENGVLVTGFLMLAARARGLGSVYLSAYQTDACDLAAALSSLLDLPVDLEPVTIVPLGFPAAEPPAKPLRPLADMLHRERYDSSLSRRD